MPIARYMIWVGTSLFALLLVANWFLPAPLPEPGHEAIDRPVIRINSIQRPPEPVVIDTNQPAIVPPPALVEITSSGNPSPLQSYASLDPSPMVIDGAKKRPKAIKRSAPRAAYQPALSNAPAVARGGTTIADIISGQLVKNLFNRR
jgi:hypothetical protein